MNDELKKIKNIVETYNSLPEDIKDIIINIPIGQLDQYYLSEAGGVTVYKSSNLYIAIQPDQGRNFEKSAYFKVSWQNNFNDNNKVARISMKSAEYIYHLTDGTELDSKTKKALNAILLSPTTSTKYPNAVNVWDALLYAIAEICNVKYEDVKKNYQTLPDYSNLQADSKRNPTKWKKG